MIIFDLDMTLANCDHRRHFVEPPIDNDEWEEYIAPNISLHERSKYIKYTKYINKKSGDLWKPDWRSFYEACDKDMPIEPTINFLRSVWIKEGQEIEIWSGRCESVREKTLDWLLKHALKGSELCPLKMRQIGDKTPDDELKERWLDEYLNNMWPKLEKDELEGTIYRRKDPIEFVVDGTEAGCKMWRRRGIFVFDVNQKGNEF